MRIAFISEYYSEGMGYIENGLTRALADLGHDVHVIASDLNIFGDQREYDSTYRLFLGPPQCPLGSYQTAGYTVHRLPHQRIGGYVRIKGMIPTLRRLAPDVIQVSSAASVNLFLLATSRWATKGRLFTACHQCSSILHPYLKNDSPLSLKRMAYFATRTFPGWLSANVTEKCYAATPDCAVVAHRYYGVPQKKIEICRLGTDTRMFRPATDSQEQEARFKLRAANGCSESDLVCIYTGRLTTGKNPLLLAKAIDHLRAEGESFRAIFIGNGPQKEEILKCSGCVVLPFVKHSELASFYRAADIGVWPFQESISMLDAAASGLPLVVNDRIGERDRAEGNGLFFQSGEIDQLIKSLRELRSKELRETLGNAGVKKMREQYSWDRIAKARLQDYVRPA